MKLRTRTNQPVEGDELENLKVSGDAKLFENIVDADGHKRFIEGEGTLTYPSKFENVYCKWSLSGTHLMLVFGATLKAGETISAYEQLAHFELPQWILDKIFPLAGNLLEYNANSVMYTSSFNQTSFGHLLNKITTDVANEMRIDLDDNAISSSESGRTFRIAYDLLIDNE